MARMIGRTKSWLVWIAGSVLALVFGGAGCGQSEPPKPLYGAPPPKPPVGKPDAQPATSLEGSKDWKVITEAWDFAMPFARSGQSTEAQRKEVDAKLAAARLVGAGLLSEREVEMLNSEADTAVKDIRREPPIGVKCYLMKYIPPARLSLQSIAARLPAIEALAGSGKVHPATIRKVLDAIEADLVVLSDPKRLAELGDTTSQADADKLRETIKTQVEKLKKLLSEAKHD